MTSSSGVPSIICAGRIYCDLVFSGVPRLPSFGTETFAEGFGIFAGGGAFITAAAFCALGYPAALYGTIPSAPFEGLVTRDFVKNGVDFSRCAVANAGADPQVTVAIAGNGDRAFLSHKAGVAMPRPTTAGLGGFRHLHIGELRTLVEHPDLISIARSLNMTISLDCGWDDDLMSAPVGFEPLVNAVDVFLPNESEYTALADAGVDVHSNTLLVVKSGAAGAWAASSVGRIQAAAGRVEVVDTTGAGDAFNAGFLSAWLDGAPLEICLARGNQCGGAIVQNCGGTAGLAQLRTLGVW